MKKILITILLLLISVCYAQEEPAAENTAAEEKTPEYGWQKPVVTAGFNITQAGFTNWAAGGENNTSWQSKLGVKLLCDTEHTGWETTAKLMYGQATGEDTGMRKSVDEIKAESIYTYKITEETAPYTAVSWLTQFTAGYEYEPEKTEISNFMDPGYFKESAGFKYSRDVFTTRLGAAIKQTVADKHALFYIKEGGKIRNEAGAESVTTADFHIMKNVLLKSKLELFSDLKASDRTDITWENDITAKVNDFISANFNMVILYDSDVSKAGQVKESLSLGLTLVLL